MISELRQHYPLKLLLRASQMARSTYFYHEKLAKAGDKYSGLKQQIQAIYHEHKGRYEPVIIFVCEEASPRNYSLMLKKQ
ncbi:MAG: hypothetical protein ON057_001447 [Glomeribacter sp. 1016415]|nr:hypothetical protein [Glomeribacter sp. 1016415]